MTEYTPKVGDRIRRKGWPTTSWVDVLLIEGRTFVGRDQVGLLANYITSGPWVKVEKPRLLPEQWLTVDHDDNWLSLWSTATGAARRSVEHDTYRVWSDPDGTPRIERIEEGTHGEV